MSFRHFPIIQILFHHRVHVQCFNLSLSSLLPLAASSQPLSQYSRFFFLDIMYLCSGISLLSLLSFFLSLFLFVAHSFLQRFSFCSCYLGEFKFSSMFFIAVLKPFPINSNARVISRSVSIDCQFGCFIFVAILSIAYPVVLCCLLCDH